MNQRSCSCVAYAIAALTIVTLLEGCARSVSVRGRPSVSFDDARSDPSVEGARMEADPSDTPISAANDSRSIRLDPKAQDQTKAPFEVIGLDAVELAALAKADWESRQWNALFAVYVQSAKDKDTTGQPAIGGVHRVEEGVLRFQPRYPLVKGVRYQAVFNPSKLPVKAALAGNRITVEFTLPKSPAAAATVVQRVFPTGNRVPENLLRFYIHFSTPMSRGDAYEHIQLLNSSGKRIEKPFLELDEEFWDKEAKRFTLFLDPGRIKRGLKPREDLGPILEEGKTYTLVIARNWSDADDNPMKQEFRKTFHVEGPADNVIDPKTWKIQPPPAGTTQAVTVSFPKPLDHALLQQLLWVTDADGKMMAGTVAVTAEETKWRFTPEGAWQVGSYQLTADTRLEDLAGNSIERPFEVDVFRPIQRQIKSATITITFHIKAQFKSAGHAAFVAELARRKS